MNIGETPPNLNPTTPTNVAEQMPPVAVTMDEMKVLYDTIGKGSLGVMDVAQALVMNSIEREQNAKNLDLLTFVYDTYFSIRMGLHEEYAQGTGGRYHDEFVSYMKEKTQEYAKALGVNLMTFQPVNTALASIYRHARSSHSSENTNIPFDPNSYYYVHPSAVTFAIDMGSGKNSIIKLNLGPAFEQIRGDQKLIILQTDLVVPDKKEPWYQLYRFLHSVAGSLLFENHLASDARMGNYSGPQVGCKLSELLDIYDRGHALISHLTFPNGGTIPMLGHRYVRKKDTNKNDAYRNLKRLLDHSSSASFKGAVIAARMQAADRSHHRRPRSFSTQ